MQETSKNMSVFMHNTMMVLHDIRDCFFHFPIVLFYQKLLYKKGEYMKPETIELIKMIEETKDKEKAILKAFAIMMDYLMPPESSGEASGAHPRSADQTSLPS